MSFRSSGALMRVAVAASAGVAVLASSTVLPLASASAQTAPTVPTPTVPTPTVLTPSGHTASGLPRPWSAASAAKLLRPNLKVGAAARKKAIAQAGATEKTASYRVSPAVLALLNDGLGMRVGASALMTGVRSGTTIRISLPAPAGLPLGLPAGSHQPRFGRSALVVNRATGAAALTASSADGALRFSIPDAATLTAGSRLTGDLRLRVPVLGETADLSGRVSYHRGPAPVSLSGHLPAGAELQHGVAELGAGAEVTLSTGGGLRVFGSALLGHPGHQLSVPVRGMTDGKGDWTLTVRPGDVAATPLPGLALSPRATGTVTSQHGVVSFDVSAPTARPWAPVRGVSVSGHATFSNQMPNDPLVPAPGIAARTPWVDVSGTIAVASAQAGMVTTHGTAAVNLASGQGLVRSSGTTPVTLATSPHRLVLDRAGFRGRLTLGKGGVTGSVRGTGQVTLTGSGRTVASEAALSVTPSGTLVTRIPAAASRLAAVAPAGRAHLAPPPAPGTAGRARAATAPAGSTTYTLSGPVFDFITKTLNIPLGSATLSGSLSGHTLTLNAAAPTALPASLPSWIPNPSYVSTQLSVDESAGTLTLTAATGTSGGQAATLTVTIAGASTSDLSDGTDVAGSLTLDGVPFVGGSAASLTFALGYGGGALSASLSGSTTTDASFANGLVTMSAGASLTLATGSGVALDGAANIHSGSSSVMINVDGALTSLSNWSLTVSDSDQTGWEPAAGLFVLPAFSGSIVDTAGSVGFDLASAGSGVAEWTSADGNATASASSLELSNQAPSAGADCSAQQVNDGDLWIGVSGGFSYAPSSLPSLNLGATGCFDLTGASATISTVATGNLTSEFGSSLPFTVTAAGLTARIGGGTYSLTGTATVQITRGVTGDPSFPVGLSLGNTGIVAGTQLTGTQMSGLGFSGSGALYVATAAARGFDPGNTFGFTGQPASIDLKAGLDISLSYTLPATVVSSLQKVIPGFPGASVQSVATLSTSGFTVDAGVVLGTGTGTGGVLVTSSSNSNVSFYLDRLDVGLALGSQNQVTLSGTGYLQLPALSPGASPSALTITVGGSFNITSLTLSLTFNVGNLTNALGVTGLNAQDFGGSFGVTLESGVPTPSVSIHADNLVLPASWGRAIGVVPGSMIWFNDSLSLSQPVLGLGIDGMYGQPALTPLAADPNLSSAVINSFTVSSASFELAPFGGTSKTGDPLTPGDWAIFSAQVDSVPVNVTASVNLTTPSVFADVSIGSFRLGPVQVSNSTFYLYASPTSVGLDLQGGFSYGNETFYTDVSLKLGSTMNGASASVYVTGGMPWFLQGYVQGTVYLSGTVSGDASGAALTASGAAWLTAAGNTLGPVSFTLSLASGLKWSNVSDSITQIAQFYLSAGASASNVISALEQFGYTAAAAINTVTALLK
jgi:hypothetical protein